MANRLSRVGNSHSAGTVPGGFKSPLQVIRPSTFRSTSAHCGSKERGDNRRDTDLELSLKHSLLLAFLSSVFTPQLRSGEDVVPKRLDGGQHSVDDRNNGRVGRIIKGLDVLGHICDHRGRREAARLLHFRERVRHTIARISWQIQSPNPS